MLRTGRAGGGQGGGARCIKYGTYAAVACAARVRCSAPTAVCRNPPSIAAPATPDNPYSQMTPVAQGPSPPATRGA